MPKKGIVIAIDGPAGSGKSTTAKLLAEKLGYLHIDTGAMYRAVTYHWLQLGFAITEENMMEMLPMLTLDIAHKQGSQKTLINGIDVSDAIRRPEVDRKVSEVSAVASVRQFLVDMQRKIAERGSAVLDGRDIGTVVMPEADLKVFLVANAETRAARRKKQNELKGQYLSLEEIKSTIEQRDTYDSSRKISPLVQAEDAIRIDTSGLTIEQQVNQIYELAMKVIQ